MLYIRTPTPSLRLAATDAAKTTVYGNTIDLFTLGNTYLDANYESLQLTSTGLSTYSILSRNAGTGTVRRLVLTTGTNVDQVALNTDGTVSLGASVLDSTSPLNGSVVISSGLGVKNSVSVGKSLRIFGATSGSVTFSAPATVTSYSLVLPSTVSPAANYALVSDTNGTLTWAQMTTSNPTFQSASITNSTDSSGTTSGALVVKGGVGIGGAQYLGGNLNLTGGSGANMVISSISGVAAPTLTTRSPGTRFVIYPQVGATAVDYAIGIESNHMWYSTANPSQGGHKWYNATRNTMTLDFAGNLSLYNGGGLTLTGGTSGTATLTPPATVTSYTLTLPTALPSASNMALVSTTTGTLSWAQMITPNPTFTSVAISATTDNTGLGTGSLIVAGGASIGSNLTVKSKLRLAAPTSGIVTIAIPDGNESPTFTLPGSLPTSPGQFLISDGAGALSWGSATSNIAYTANLANNVTTPTAISGLSFSDMFKIDVYVVMTTTTTTYGAMYTLRGFQSSAGWTLYEKYVGDDTGIDFSISGGQIRYTSTNVANWTGSRADWTGPEEYSTPTGGVPQNAPGANNQIVPANVTGLVMSPPQFSSYVLVTVNNSTTANSMVTLYQIQGTLQQSGTWAFTSQIVSGPDPGIRFSILSSGQIQYTSPNTTGWLSTNFQFYGTAVPLQNEAKYAGMSITGGVDATSSTTGDLTVTGGVGIGGSLYAGNMFIGTNTVATQAYVTGLGYITSSALTPYLTSATAASTYLHLLLRPTSLYVSTHHYAERV